MKVLFFKKTKLANNPDLWAEMLKKHRGFDTCVDNKIRKKYDFVHFSNTYLKFEGFEKKSLMHYQGHPRFEGIQGMLDKDFPGKVLINAPHVALGGVPSSYKPIRWFPIDLSSRYYDVKNPTDKIRICFTPSKKRAKTKYHDKGYYETVKILEEIKKKFGSAVDIKVATGIPYEDCLKLKSQSNIVIDECVTPNYHQSGLEGLGMGKMVVGSVSQANIDLLKNIVIPGSEKIPYENVDIKNLQDFLQNVISNKGLEYILNIGNRNKEWMVKNWNINDILDDMIENYNEVLKK